MNSNFIVAAIFVCLLGPQLVQAQQPNVVVIICDDAGYADFGFMNGLSGEVSEIPTPNLDALARRGVTFSRAYVGEACQPTRAALVTGGYQNRIGNEVVGNNLTSASGVFEGVPVESITIWERMKSLGYTTAAVGKWHLGQIADTSPTQLGNRPQNQGIDEFFGIWHGSRTYSVGNANLSQTQLLREAINANGTITDTVVETNYSGDYITNTFGDYAVDFIADHYDDPNPFFLYQSFTAPHTPMQNSPDFNDPSLAGLSGIRKTYGSMMLTMDKEIGRIIDQLDDPNGDGNTSDSITDNTLIFFVNDNGGADENSSSPNGADNGILRRGKGSPWEGGIRVPMLMAGAGINASAVDTVYEKSVHGVDILATAFEAGGGMFGPADTGIDGVNLLPFVNGLDASDPHEVLINRHRSHFSVIKGDWKLTWSGGSPGTNPQLYNLANDISETSNVASSNPAIVADLVRELTDQETEFDKQRYAILGRSQDTINLFDHFRFNPVGTSVQNWLDTNSWVEGGTSMLETMFFSDSYASTVLEFPTSNLLNYTSNNNMVRLTGLPYMLNRIELTGFFNSSQSRTATIQGNSLLFTRSLQGVAPELVIDAANSSSGQFTYEINTGLIMYDDLLISGDGDAHVSLNGEISDFFVPSDLIKTGSSTIVLTGNNTFNGETIISSGVLALSGAGTLGGSVYIDVQAGAALDASLANNGVDLNVDQTLGGEGSVIGDVTAGSGSAVDPAGSDIGQLDIVGSYTHLPGATLAMQIGANGNDVLNVNGVFNATGGEIVVTLDAGVNPVFGQSFQLINSSSFSGDFDSFQLPALGAGLGWDTSELATTGTLTVGDPTPIITTELIDIIGDSTNSATVAGLNSNLGNGDYQSIASGTGGIPYTQIPNWFHVNGSESVNHGQTNNTAPLSNPQAGALPRNYVAFQFNNRTNINDTAYTPIAGDKFSFGTYWIPNGSGIAATDTLTVTLYTSTAPVDGDVTSSDLTAIGSTILSVGNTTGFYTAPNFYTATGLEGPVYLGLQLTSGPSVFSRTDLVTLSVVTTVSSVLKGDVSLDGSVNFLDISPFIGVLTSNDFQLEADCDCDGNVNFLDIAPFIAILAGN